VENDEQAAQDPEWSSTRPGSGRPKWLSAVSISAIVMGCLFGCCGLAGIGGLVAGSVMNPAALPPTAQDQHFEQFQRQYMERSAAFQRRTLPLSLTSSGLALVHAALLAVAGGLAYRANKLGRRLLAALCFAGIAVELVSGYVGLYVASEQNAVMAPLMDEMMKKSANAGPAQSEQQKRALETTRGFMAMAFKAGNVFSWLTVLGFFVVKSAYYLICALYLRRADVIAYFEPQAAPAAAA
jgi:hypothetical protein